VITGKICALIIGRAGSTGFPGKNMSLVLGRPLCSYPMMAARASRYIDHLYVSTDSPEIMAIANQFGAQAIHRPPSLATKEALGEDVFRHGYEEIARRLSIVSEKVELMVLLFANGANVTGAMIDKGIESLREDDSIDSAVSVSEYNMWSPLRARKIGPDGCLEPFVPFETFGDPATLNCDRDSQGSVLFADMGVSIVRPRCLDNLDAGMLPQKWMGRRIYPILSWAGCDIDFDWQVPQVEFWLRKNGYNEY
jgi:hypothetical protein